MAGTAELILRIVGKDDTSAVFGGVADKVKNLNKGLVAGGAAFAATGGTLLKVGGDFDEAFDNIQIGTGATGDSLKGLQGDFKAVFTSVPTDMAHASTAISLLNTTTGATGKTLQDMARTAINVSRLTGTDLTSNIEGVTQVTNNWGIGADGTAAVMDKLFVASQKTGVPITELTKGVTDNSESLRAMGFSLDESIALVGGLGKAGIDSTTAMAGITHAVAGFAKEGIDAKTGISQTFDAIKNAKTDTEATSIAVQAFGARAGSKLADQIRTGKFSVDDLTASLQQSGGAINQTAADTDDFGQKLQVWKNKAITALSPVSGQVFNLANAFVGLGPGIIAVAPAFAGLSKGIGAVSTAATFAKGPLLSMGAALLTPPLGIVIAIAAVLVAAFLFRDQIIGAFKAVFSAVAPVVGAISKAITGAFGAVLDFLKSNWPIIVTIISGPFAPLVALATNAFGVRDTLLGAFSAIQQGITSTVNAIASFLTGAWDAISGAATTAWTTIKNTITGVWDAIFGAIQTTISSIEGFISGAWDTITGAASAGWSAIQGAIQGGLDSIWGAITSWGSTVIGFFTDLPGNIVSALGDLGSTLFDAGKKLIQGFIDGIKSLPIPNPLDLVPGGGIVKKGLSLVGLAGGGSVIAGTPYIVGEHGPELFVPNSSGHIIPNDKMGGSAIHFNGPITVNNIGATKDAQGTLRDVAFSLAANLRAKGMWVPA